MEREILKERYDTDIDWALESNPGSTSWAQIQTLSFNDCAILGEPRNHGELHFHTTVPRNRNSSLVGQQGG